MLKIKIFFYMLINAFDFLKKSLALTLLHVVEFSRYDCALVAKFLLRAGQPIKKVSRHAQKP